MTAMVPEKILDARTANFGIGHLLASAGFDHRSEYDPDAVWLFDTILPPFQRGVEWDEAMMVRFIESIWMGMDIGRYVVNDAQDAPGAGKRAGGKPLWHPSDRWLIDGQQRLTAIHRYVSDRFPIVGADGIPHLWSDLPKPEQRRFGNRPFDRGITRIYSELDLMVLYDRMNYGGVRHREDQRALPDGEPEYRAPSARMVPEKTFDARTASFGIGHLLAAAEFDHRSEYDPDAVWLFDTILPPFQRGVEWDEAMMVRFIESIWMGMDIGRYVVNDAQDAPGAGTRAGGKPLWHPSDRWLIDGQQRLTAIHRYVSDRFPIVGADGIPHLWSELPKVDQRHFASRQFDRGITSIHNELDLRILYDRMNYGGVRHREDQRALPDGEPDGWTPAPGMR